jgi:nucleotide-binding universal stress UspA family protein
MTGNTLKKQNNSILVALNDSVSSRAVVDFLIGLSLCPEDWRIHLLHFFRKPSSSEELMGKKYMNKLPAKMMSVLQRAKDKLIENGFHPEQIRTELVEEPYPTIAEGIIDQVGKQNFDMVVIGRKKMSKAEEFVMGDISVKLVRALENAAILVVKSK